MDMVINQKLYFTSSVFNSKNANTIKLSSTCEEFKFRGWYDAALRLERRVMPATKFKFFTRMLISPKTPKQSKAPGGLKPNLWDSSAMVQ